MKNKKTLTIVAVVVVIVAIIVGINIYQSQKEPEVIKIGAILPLTGPAASFGQYVKEGIDLAIEEIITKSNMKFSILYYDSKNDPKEAVSGYNKMVLIEKPSVVIAALSSVASALAPLAISTNTIQIYVDVAKPGVADGKYCFRVYPEANGTAGVIAEFVANTLRATKAAVILINDDYGRASLDVFKRRFEASGGKVVFIESYQLLQKDFRDILTKLKSVKPMPDVIYLNGYGPSFVTAVRQIREQGIKIQLVADVALGLPENLKGAGEAAEGTYFVDTDMSPEFIEKFIHKYGKEPSSDAGYAYDIIKILYKIVQENPKLTSNYISEQFRSLKDFPGVTGLITMKPNGDAELRFVVKQIIQGKPLLIKRY
ncbi:MAG: ABC transporter substrate-binding protein [Candidatus Pacearchaeota archaeon]